MAISGFDPTDPRVQLEILREKFNNAEATIQRLERALAQVEKTLAQAQANLARKEAEVNQLRVEREELKLNWELAKSELRHAEEDKSSKNKASRERAVNATLLLASASAFAGYGINLLTQTPSNLTGIALLAIAIILYWIGARSTALLA